MIRVLALMLLALPAQAQSFHGLLPGMPTSELARLGEPFDLQSEGGVTAARYPQPFERQLSVFHGGGQILSIGMADVGSRMRPPDVDALMVGVSSLEEAIAVAGSEGYTYDSASALVMVGDRPIGWRLFYDVPAHPDLILEMTFHRRGLSTMTPEAAAQIAELPGDATLVSIALHHAQFVADHPDIYGSRRVDRPDTAPFATPLSEALPLF